MWHQNKYIVIPLVIIILGHWSLILQGPYISSASSLEALTLTVVSWNRCLVEGFMDRGCRMRHYRNQQHRSSGDLHLFHVFRSHRLDPFGRAIAQPERRLSNR